MIRSRFKHVLKEKGLRVRDIKEAGGFSTDTVTKLSRDDGIATCTLATLERAAQALGVKIKDLFDEV